MTPKKAKKAKRGGKPPAKKPARGARKAASAKSAPAAPQPVPATPDDTPSEQGIPIQLDSLSPLALFEVGLAVGKVEMFCATYYYKDYSSVLLDNLAMELGVLGGCLESLRQYVPFENPFRKIIHAAHKQLESITNIERPEFANRHFLALDNVVAKLRRLECESLLFNFGRMIGHVAHDGFNSRHSNKDYNVTAEVLREAIKGVAIPSLVTETEPILNRMEGPIRQLPSDALPRAIVAVLSATMGQAEPPSPGAPPPARGREYKVDVIAFPEDGRGKASLKVNGAEVRKGVSVLKLVRFLVIHHASASYEGIAFKAKEVKARAAAGVQRLPGEAAFHAHGRCLTNPAMETGRVHHSIFGGDVADILDLEHASDSRDKIGTFRVERYHRLTVSMASSVKVAIKKHCMSTFGMPEAEIDGILGACQEE